MDASLARRLGAEFLGTFVLVFVGCGAAILDNGNKGIDYLGVAMAFGVAVMVMVSAPEPAAHSPGSTPEAVSALAEVSASRSVHMPSSAGAMSEVLLTTIPASAGAGRAEEKTAVEG